MKKRYTFIIIFLLFGITAAFAQSFSTKVSSAIIGKKDILQVEYVAENIDLQDLVLPVFNGWTILSGPNFSSNRLQTGNIVKQQVVYTILLQPQATGKLNIPGAKATIDNKTRLSNSVSVEVKDADHVQGNQQAAPPNPAASLLDQLSMGEEDMNDDQVLKKGENARDKINNNLFVKLDVSKKTAYVGESVLATYKLCTRIRSQSRVTRQPAFSGCTVIEMTADDPLPQKEKIGDKWYNVYIIRQVQLIPLQAGMLDLPQASVENKVTFYRQGQVNYRDLFYNNPSVKPEELTVTFTSSPKQLEVKALPLPAPAGFSGAVGNFTIRIDNDTNGGQTNNSNQVKIIIDGQGNLQQVKAPPVSWPKYMEGFEPTEKDDMDKKVFPAHSVKIFSYPFVADKTGAFTIEPVSFTYFNANQNKYITTSTRPLNLRVQKGARTILPADKPDYNADFHTRLYILLGAGLLAIIGGLTWYNRKPKKPVVQPENITVFQKEAPAVEVDTNEYIHQIRELEPTLEGPPFYRQLNKSITGWLKDKYNIRPDQLNEFAAQKPHHSFALQKLAIILNSCSAGMYTPIYNVEDAVQHRLTALEAINTLEKTGQL